LNNEHETAKNFSSRTIDPDAASAPMHHLISTKNQLEEEKASHHKTRSELDSKKNQLEKSKNLTMMLTSLLLPPTATDLENEGRGGREKCM